MKYFFIILILTGAVCFSVAPARALVGIGKATDFLDKSVGTKQTGLVGGGEQGLSDVIGTIVKVALSLVGSVFLVLTIYAGILWMTASGNEDQIATSKKIVTAAVIGLFITMAAYTITFFVTSKLSNVGNGGGQVLDPYAGQNSPAPFKIDPVCTNNKKDNGSAAACKDQGSCTKSIGGHLDCAQQNDVCCLD